MKPYTEIKQSIEASNDLHSVDYWRHKLSGAIPASDFDCVFAEMVEAQDVVVFETLVYPLNNKTYAVGIYRSVRETFGFVENEFVSIYVGKDDSANALDLDTVLVNIKNSEKQYGVIITSLKHGRDVLLGTMVKRGKSLSFVPYDTRITHHVVYESNNHDLNENDRVVGKLLKVDTKVHVIIDSVLGQADEPGMDVRSVLFVNGIDVDFKPEVLEEANRIKDTLVPEDYVGRVDHRDQYVITIDGEDAKDLDDAIYMEPRANGYRLYVHIADVSHYVKPETQLWDSALDRSSSVYLVDRVVPMLPKNLSNGICSLHPHVDRLVMTCQIDLDFNANVLDYHVYESIIQSKRRMSYNEVNTVEDLGSVQDMITLMRECARRLAYNREEAGSIGFDSDESKFIVDNDGNILDVFRRETGEAEVMIEMFMVLANQVVAQLTRYQFIPTLYRVHEHPNKEKMQDLSHTLRILGYVMKGNLEEIKPKTLQKALEFFKDKPEYPVVSKLMLRSMSKAKYSPEPLGHFGLALEDYAHFTSPIRRFPDLLLHQRIKQYHIHQDRSHVEADEAMATEAGMHVSSKERAILDAERTVEKIKKAQFMVGKEGEKYLGYISGVSNYGLFVELPNTIEGLVHVRELKDDYYTFNATAQKMMGERTKKTYSIGQKVTVRLESVNLVENVINFRLIEKKSVYPARRRPKSHEKPRRPKVSTIRDVKIEEPKQAVSVKPKRSKHQLKIKVVKGH